jgi:hypothetical protein
VIGPEFALLRFRHLSARNKQNMPKFKEEFAEITGSD